MDDRQSTRPSQTTDDLNEITKSKGKNKRPISIAESTSNKRQQGDSLSALTRLREKSQHEWWSGIRKIALRSTRTHSALDCRLTEGVLR
ncbi:hypothetical protein L915_12120 [Phytophthora nicotianae]|uniref:Uncharacterized protein n=2 Tax=Phytophthora nicotianae TaxID=4792 RepID=W2GHN1_PHYNI|nr:hypothetical protein L915_12120 [Phytophthora nicotianae]ETO71132.1 hypothetical protein F444_12496 [Phytophthora nicotianae P1976]